MTETKPKRWYIVHAYSNFEKKVAQHLTDQALHHIVRLVMGLGA